MAAEECPAAAPLCPLSGIRGCTHRHPPQPSRWRRWLKR